MPGDDETALCHAGIDDVDIQDELTAAARRRIFAKRASLMAEKAESDITQERLSARRRQIDRELAECHRAAKFFALEE